jgi:hypothetical protein
MRELWRWHGAGEMEHKAVACDVYRTVGGSEALHRTTMRRVTVFFMFELLRGLLYRLRKEGKLFSARHYRSGLAALFGKQGTFKGSWDLYEAFYKEDFHPWDQDTQELLVAWEAKPRLPKTLPPA